LGREIVGSVTTGFFNGYLQNCNEARGTPRGKVQQIDGRRIKGCSQNVIVRDDLLENRHYRNVDDIKTKFDLRLLKCGTEFGMELRGMDDGVVFSKPLLFNKIKGTCVQQDQ